MVMDFEGKEGYEFGLNFPPPKKTKPVIEQAWLSCMSGGQRCGNCFSGYFMHGSLAFPCMNLGQSCVSEKITFW